MRALITLLLAMLVLASAAYGQKLFPAEHAAHYKKISKQTAKKSKEREVTSTSPATTDDQSSAAGTLFVDLPWKAEQNKPFRMDVWYVPKVRQKATVTVTKSPSGLAEIIVTSECCDDISMSVDTGFKGRLKWKTPPALESRTIHPATIEIVDSQDRPLQLDAPIHLRLSSSNAQMQAQNGKWVDTLEFVLRDGESSTPTFLLRPTPFDASTGGIQVTGFLNDESYTVLKSNLDFDVTPPWWLRLSMAAFGGLLFSAYRTFRGGREWTTRRVLSPLGVGLLAGGFAYIIADWDVLGIKTDTTHLRAFVVLGLVVSYVGIEPLLAAITKRLKVSGDDQKKRSRD